MCRCLLTVKLLTASFFLWLCVPVFAEQITLTNAAQIRALTPQQARAGIRASLTGVVTFADPTRSLLFVQDQTGGLFISPQARAWDWREGQKVAVSGIVAQGSHLPFISTALLTDLGFASIPAPRLPAAEDLAEDREDANWIEIRGVVRTAAIKDGQLQLEIVSLGKRIQVEFADSLVSTENPSALIDSEVVVHGVCGQVHREAGSTTLLDLHCPNLEDLFVRSRPPSDLLWTEAIPIASVTNFISPDSIVHQVHIRGVLTVESGNAWSIRDESGTISIEPLRSWIVPTNKMSVEAVGFPAGTPQRPCLEDARVFALGLSAPDSGKTNSEYLPILGEIQRIRELPPGELQRGYPVKIRGTITCCDAAWGLLFIDDESAGIYSWDPGMTFNGNVGDLVEVEGFTALGQFAPMIRGQRFHSLGKGRIPKARRTTVEKLMSGSEDAQWVELQGTIRYTSVEDGHLTVQLFFAGGILNLFVPLPATNNSFANLIDSEVTVRGVCGAESNREHQFTGVHIYLNGLSDIEITKPAPADPFAAPLQPITNLMRFQASSDLRHRVRLHGTVTFRDVNWCTAFIQFQGRGIYIRLLHPPAVEVGDEADVVGFLNSGSFGPELSQALIRKTSKGTAPVPAKLDVQGAVFGNQDGQLVEVEALLVDRVRGTDGKALVLQQGSWVFTAILESSLSPDSVNAIACGSLLRLTGICCNRQNPLQAGIKFSVQLRSLADIKILEEPAWWTPARLFGALGATLAVLGATAMWVFSLRRVIRKRTAALQHSEAQLTAIYDNTPIMMCVVSENNEVERMNRAMADFFGRTTDGEGRSPGHILGCANPFKSPQGCGRTIECATCPVRLAINETFVSGRSSKQVERSFKPMRDGLRRELWVSASTALVETAQTTYVLLCVEDITGRKRLEAQFLQAQKMEAIGQLAGGVAHDFNNILTATLLNLSFLRRSCKLDPQMLEGLLDLEKDAQRAAALTRQLLTFSRRQAMEPKRLDFSELIQGLSRMLARLLGEHITMRFVSPPEMMVTADAGMLEQVVVNLCVNARDAMPKGGQLVLTLDHQEIDSKQAQRHPDAQVGRFVRLSVADTGIGMDHATLQHIFEPFFTTKDIGKGTGLGLATVYGIAKQHRGWVEVESVLGQGSTFYVFLPVADAVESLASHELMHLERGGSETVLLVEDDQSLRRIASMVLRRFGYEVIEAQDSVDALRAWEVHAIRIQLLIADMVLPEGMSGLDLASRLRQFKPKLKVLISSGYSVDLAPERLTKNSMKFLAKPYQPETLVKIIRDYLDEA